MVSLISLIVRMERNFVEIFIDCIAKIASNDSVTFLCNFSIFLPSQDIQLYSICKLHNLDITVHNNFSKIISNLQRDRYIPH